MNKIKWLGKTLQPAKNSGSAHGYLHHGRNGKPRRSRPRLCDFALQQPTPSLENPIIFRVSLRIVLWRIKVSKPVGLGVNDLDIAIFLVAVQGISFGADGVPK